MPYKPNNPFNNPFNPANPNSINNPNHPNNPQRQAQKLQEEQRRREQTRQQQERMRRDQEQMRQQQVQRHRSQEQARQQQEQKRRDRKPTSSAENLEKLMGCPTCGYQNYPDARFCIKCGSRLSQGGQASNMEPQQSQFGTQDTGPGGVGWQSSTSVNQPLPIFVPQRSAAPTPATAPAKPVSRGGYVGFARNIQPIRTEQSGYGQGSSGSYQILSFRLEQYDSSGNRTNVVPVDMRGRSIIGYISDGDRVEVLGKWEGGLLQSKLVHDLSTGATVKVKRGAALVVTLITMGVILLLIGVGLFLFIPRLGMNNSPDQVLTSYCDDIQSGSYSEAYNQYSDKLKGEVTSTQFIQMWSGKFIDACVPGAIQITGNQATTTLSMHNGPTNSTSTYQVTLRQDGSNGWRIDSLQPQ